MHATGPIGTVSIRCCMLTKSYHSCSAGANIFGGSSIRMLNKLEQGQNVAQQHTQPASTSLAHERDSPSSKALMKLTVASCTIASSNE